MDKRSYQRKSSNTSRPRRRQRSRSREKPRRKKSSPPRGGNHRKSSPQVKTIQLRRRPAAAGAEKSNSTTKNKNSKYIRLGGDGDVNKNTYYGGGSGSGSNGKRKTVETKQDVISKDPKLMKSKFKGFSLIKPEQYKYVNEGTFIRYLKDGKIFRFGGYLKNNKWPDYWVLQNKTRGDQIASWCVPLKGKNIYASRDNDRSQDDVETKAMKETFYKLKSGEYKLVPTASAKGKTKQRKSTTTTTSAAAAADHENSKSVPVKILFVGETD